MKIFCDHAKRKLLQKGVTLRIHQRLLCSKSKVSLFYSFSPALLFLCSLDALFALFPHYNMSCGLATQLVLFIENPAVLKLLLKMFKRKKHCSPSHRWKHIQKINRLRVWEWKTRHSAAKPCNISGPMSSSTVTQTVVKDRLLIRPLQNNTQDLTAAIPFYISKDWMPFQIVQRSGFVKVMKVAMPPYKVPSQTLFFKTEIPTCTSRLKLLLHKIKLQFKVHALQQVRGWSTTKSNFSVSVTSEQAGINPGNTVSTILDEFCFSGFFQYARKIPELHNNRERQNMSEAFKVSLDLWLVAFWPLLEPCF